MGNGLQPGSGLSSAQFAAAMEHSPIGIAIVGLGGQWLWTNISIRKTLGYSREELESLTFQDITHPDDLALDLDHVRSLIEGHGTAYQMEKRYLHGDGHHVWCLLSVSIVRGEDGAPDYFISKVQDIDQRKADEIERAKLAERLTLATRAGGVGVWEWDIVGGKMIWDARMFQLYGMEPSSGAPDFDEYLAAIHADDRQRVEGLIRDAVEERRLEYDLEFSIITPCGSLRRVRSISTVVQDAGGTPIRLVGTNLDVTEMRHLVVLAEQAARAKSEFLATISHELRTPLNSIIGFSRLVLSAPPPRDEAPLPPTARRHIELVRDASTTLLTIVDDVLDFSRIEAGGFELSPAPFALRPMVEGAIEIVRGVAEAKGLTLVAEIAADIPEYSIGDENRLRQVLLNLLGNAVKFTARGGVRVTVDTIEGGETRWQVSDSGIGIDADKQHLLFKRFSQVDRSITRRFGGSGLGLAICERLVSAMNGEVGVRSEPGVGSCFWFSAPLPEANVAAPLAVIKPQGAPVARAGPSRILLAEDVELNQLLAVALLEGAGHSVAVVNNGAEAVERVQSERFDLVLMDVQMPVMDGVEATQKIRALGGPYAALPIVALTANVLPDEIARFRAAGMNDHVGKPIAVDALDQAIARWTAPIPVEPAVSHG